MAKKSGKIRADRNAAETGKKGARKKAEAAFKKDEALAAAAEADSAATLKTTVMDLGLASRRDYAHHLATIVGLEKKKDDIVGLLRNARKRAKEANVDPAHLDAGKKWANMDPLEFARFIAGAMRSMEVAGGKAPQLSFFDESKLNAEEKAFQDGYRAGLAGKNHATNPHDVNSDIGRAWERGRERGQLVLAGQAFGVDPKIVEAIAEKAEAERGTLFEEDEAALQARAEGDNENPPPPDEEPDPLEVPAALKRTGSPAVDAARANGVDSEPVAA